MSFLNIICCQHILEIGNLVLQTFLGGRAAFEAKIFSLVGMCVWEELNQIHRGPTVPILGKFVVSRPKKYLKYVNKLAEHN